MKYSMLIGCSLTAAVLISGCGPAGDQMVNMCQKITQNLIGTVEVWQEPIKSEGGRFATVELAYDAASGDKGVAVCKHPKESGSYRTAPSEMTLNGVTVPQRDLISASFGATKEIVKDTAEHTKEKAGELAQEASVKAKELADEAQAMAEDAKVKAEELAAKAETLAGEAKEKASVLAEEARAKATELAAQAQDLSSVATEKAREAALEATKAVQQQLEK